MLSIFTESKYQVIGKRKEMNQTQTADKTEFSIHPATTIGGVSLRVANLENQLTFYQQALGFQLHWREGNQAGLGAGGTDLLRLTEEPNLKKYHGVTGLYHFAVLFPNRRTARNARSTS
jgi:catechol 2,3-dioxygenase